MKNLVLIIAFLLAPSLSWGIAFNERDPQVGTVTNTGVCVGDGSAVQCATDSEIHTTGESTSGIYTITVAASCTIGVDCDGTSRKVQRGGIVYVTGAATVTLDAIADGDSVTVITVGAVAVSVDSNASDKLWLNGTALDDGDKITNLSTSDNTAVCTYYSADGFWCKTDSWTDGGP